MSRLQHQLVQSITCNGELLDLAFLKQATFIETMSLDGPKLIIEYDDKEQYLRDDLALKEGDVFSVNLSDPVNLDLLNWQSDWTVITMPADAKGTITFNLLLTALYELKKPTITAKFFVKKSISHLLRQLAPNLNHEIGEFPLRLDFHLLPGQRPTRLIRQIARELGAVVFIRRGILVFKSLEQLQNQQSAFEYHFNDTRQQFQIASYTIPNDQTMIDDLTQRRFTAWDDKQGVVYARNNSDRAIEFVGATNRHVLDNLCKVPVPVIDAIMLGNGGLKAGDVMAVTWNRSDLERPIDESLPTSFVLSLVAHSYVKHRYYCRIKGVLDKYSQGT